MFIFFEFSKMGDNETVEPRRAEVDEDGAPIGCTKMYHFDDTDERLRVELDCGSYTSFFPANRKPAEKYYEILKGKKACQIHCKWNVHITFNMWNGFRNFFLELLIGLDAHNLFAIDQCSDYLETAKDGQQRFETWDKLILGRAQGFVMAYNLVKLVSR